MDGSLFGFLEYWFQYMALFNKTIFKRVYINFLQNQTYSQRK